MQYWSATILPSASLPVVIASWHLFILIREQSWSAVKAGRVRMFEEGDKSEKEGV